MKFGKMGPYRYRATYTDQLAFSTTQASDERIFSTGTSVKIDHGHKATLTKDKDHFSPSQTGTSGVVQVFNNTGTVQDLAFGFIDNGELMPTPTLYFPNVEKDNSCTAKFTPVLRAYITSDYQEAEIFLGRCNTLWSQDLTALTENTTWSVDNKLEGPQTFETKQEVAIAFDKIEDPEPTGRDIMQGIHNLGRRLDLLVTNERVDALDARVGMVEEIFGRRLTALEQHLNASDVVEDDLAAHRPSTNTTAYAPLHHPNAHLPLRLAHNAGGDEDPGISTIGRQWIHAWDPSAIMGTQGHVGMSAYAAHIADTPDTSLLPTS
ncbi:uncharacterized protein F5147DRAFT_840366 [Suillus discolor]|uniref:Uncharacterized protein n=1 Tax=Suillus discolor TaxID=1912936 RepID=A0A9P7EXL0_9AGAM|nr:uncharacterized protein F5147DRAFT_840366 [Suillus discolor]KAG2094240.1 hypothetical protein F5147DRAFT_840366 [Suillus discolor]